MRLQGSLYSSPACGPSHRPSACRFVAHLCGNPAQVDLKMLIQFTVANFKSFREPQTLSMVAAPTLKRLRELNTFTPKVAGHRLPALLRCAAIFGPNAAGKSNLVKALSFVEFMVMRSADLNPDDPLDVQSFRLDETTSSEDSTFEVDFIEGECRFQFGFSANRDRITSEWMICYTSNRPTELYRRQYDHESKQDAYIFGRALEGGRLRKDWAAQSGPKTLFLSRVVQASSEEFQQLRVPYRWFSKRLRIDKPTRLQDRNSYTSQVCETEEGKRKVLEFLNAFDIPVVDIEIQRKKLSLSDDGSPFKAEFLRELKLDSEFTFRDPVFTHLSSAGKPVAFTANDESEGTMNLYHFAAKWIDVIENSFVLVVDELDSSLHPLAVWELIRRLRDSRSEAQLIFTTHDIAVLRSKLLRRDQTFFVSPTQKRESQLYSLMDFKGREEDAFEDRYLQGRYGATPLITR
ncbi:MAG: ATP-binding protein [Rhodocyclaceae bacterium]|jgi:hypothetical protein|nr:MAG: ATP-binding protein [Rhodocyclaceae bacterium]